MTNSALVGQRVQKRRALIIGVSGQDGAYLAEFLLSKEYIVYGTTRALTDESVAKLNRLGIADKIVITELEPTEFFSLYRLVEDLRPSEIYNLAGQSSVGLSFSKPLETQLSIVTATANLLEVARSLDKDIKIYSAGSGEIFGDTGQLPASEETPHNPVSPYGVAKASARDLVKIYRETYGLHASTGILFNHESPLRPESYVTQKIIRAAIDIRQGNRDHVMLGNINIERDWGYAPEYVTMMWKMLQNDAPQDFIVATGVTVSLKSFVQKAFSYFGLDWNNHVIFDDEFKRVVEIGYSAATPEKARKLLGWTSSTSIDQLIEKMIIGATFPAV